MGKVTLSEMDVTIPQYTNSVDVYCLYLPPMNAKLAVSRFRLSLDDINKTSTPILHAVHISASPFLTHTMVPSCLKFNWPEIEFLNFYLVPAQALVNN